MKSRSWLVLAGAILCGGVAGGLAFVYQNDATKRVVVKTMPTVQIVVAARDLPVGTVTDSTDFRLLQWPKNAQPEGTVTEMSGLLGRGVASPIGANEPITERKLGAAGAGAGLLALVPDGMRAVTVKIDENVSPFVAPGVNVDLIGGLSSGVTRVIMQNVPVIAVGTSFQPGKRDDKNNATITLLVSPSEAEVVALASLEAKLRIALRNNMDAEARRTPGARLTALFANPTEATDRPAVRRPSPAVTPVPVPKTRADSVETFRRDKKSVTTIKPGA